MSTQHYAITGIPADDANNPPPRREISGWYTKALQDEKGEFALQVSLFIQALARFQQKAFTGVQEDIAKLSYYRIASIHGLPLVPWDGVGDKTRQRKFCAHNMATFPSWHRPYLALYEQLLYKNMLELIESPNAKFGTLHPKGAWLAAAKQWRLPYWDYATNAVIPAIAAKDSIDVLGFDGGKLRYGPNLPNGLNPMYTYRPQINGTVTPFGKLPTGLALQGNWAPPKGTSRQPQDNGAFIEGVSDIQAVSDAFIQHDWGMPKSSGTIKENVSRLINENYFHSWSAFASTRYWQADKATPRVRDWLSLESLHNGIHGFVGGDGQMSDPSVAAFDPIFWVHHCFIDMIFNSWQVNTKYAYWFNNPVDPTDPTEQPTSWLKPFYDGNNKEFDSNKVLKTTSLGYTYDSIIEEEKKAGTANDSQLRLNVRRAVNQNFNMTRSEVQEMLPDRKTDNDLIINVRYNRAGLNNGDPYWIHFFVGEVGEPKDYLKNPDLVGSVYNFSAPYEESGCKECKDQAEKGILATGQVPITGAILKDWLNRGIDDLPTDGPFNEASVEAYLKKNLDWRVVTPNGQAVTVDSLPDLKVFALLGDADHSQDEHVSSTFDNYEPLWGATSGKPAGGNPGDAWW